MKTMTIEEIKKTRCECEEKIHDALIELQRVTGFDVTYITITRNDYPTTIGVKITLELP